MSDEKTVVITGDVTIDWNLAYHLPDVSSPKASFWTPQDRGRLYWQRGGAALLGDLVNAICSPHSSQIKVSAVNALEEISHISFESREFDKHNHSFALWDIDDPDEAYYRDHCRWQLPDGSKDEEDAHRRVWRVREFLGFHKSTQNVSTTSYLKDLKEAQVIIIDDAGYGFEMDARLKDLLKSEKCKWAVLKISGKREERELLSSPITQPLSLANSGAAERGDEGENAKVIRKKEQSRFTFSRPSLDFIAENCSQKSIMILNIRDLRAIEGTQVARGLSWERAAHDVVRELKQNPHLNQLRKCQWVIISLDTAGAVVMKPDQSFILFYDPRFLEGEWERAIWGRMMGYTTTLTASLVHRLIESLMVEDTNTVSLEVTIKDGIKKGIAAMRELYRSGYLCKCDSCTGAADDWKGYLYQKQDETHSPALVFPKDKIAEYLRELDKGEAAPILKRVCDEPISINKDWSILNHKVSSGQLTQEKPAQAEALARHIATEGFGHGDTTGIPSFEIGELYTVDRMEIETLRSVQHLMRAYQERSYARRRPLAPLNLAVFGPPGAGKSFVVEQVAASALSSSLFDNATTLSTRHAKTFNLSQFDNVQALNDALHQVRDIGLAGGFPLVFWDEFDTKMGGSSLAWLRYFLAPMQDGEFLQGEVTHYIGPCIFVFAGGIYD